jgi:hypothetical protein
MGLFALSQVARWGYLRYLIIVTGNLLDKGEKVGEEAE